MTDPQILHAAFSKADPHLMVTWDHFDIYELIKSKRHLSTLFSHDFAKAFFGNEDISCGCHGEDRCVKCVSHWISHEIDYEWQYHLQQMVLEEDPIQYLAKFL